ncbi:cytidine deaminase-like protein [Marasmius fiardii PR-910]|nr:cytidine deaminase-like protein [Marasmius fiardii PR-910]
MSSPSPSPHHLNTVGCRIGISPSNTRGVFASRPIRQGTLIEISPVLLISKEEYEKHGKYTVLDHYTFKWRDGRMALALGLGSLFNHSDKPNISYTLDFTTETISYRTARDVEPDEELLIVSGHSLWFEQVDSAKCSIPSSSGVDEWDGSSVIDDEQPETRGPKNPFEGDSDAIVEDELLPFTRIKPPPEEETLESIRTVPAWVVEIPDQRHITTLLKWLKTTGLDGPELGHLKRIRKQNDNTTLLLSTSPISPALPDDVPLPETYQVSVPIAPAFTLTSLKLKSLFWPTYYTPRRTGEVESWSRGRCKWAWDAIEKLILEARHALSDGELPIAAHVPSTLNEEDYAILGRDTRTSTKHPLRHAVLNLVRALADNQSVRKSSPQAMADAALKSGPLNGSRYLLTSRTIFLTHEPCIMCSMALLHSRVKEVFFLLPMQSTGGCGGVTCLPTLPGVNHRFQIFRWTLRDIDTKGLVIDENTDA